MHTECYNPEKQSSVLFWFWAFFFFLVPPMLRGGELYSCQHEFDFVAEALGVVVFMDNLWASKRGLYLGLNTSSLLHFSPLEWISTLINNSYEAAMGSARKWGTMKAHFWAILPFILRNENWKKKILPRLCWSGQFPGVCSADGLFSPLYSTSNSPVSPIVHLKGKQQQNLRVSQCKCRMKNIKNWSPFHLNSR